MGLLLIYIIVPVLLSGITFIFVLKFHLLSSLTTPLDNGYTWRGRRILGDNKTFRGPVVMSVFTSVYGVFLYMLCGESPEYFNNLSLFAVWIGYLLVGLGYSLGELPNSFVKRQLNINPGEYSTHILLSKIFMVADTFDSLIMSGIVYILYFSFAIQTLAVAIFIGGGLHILTDLLMRNLKLKK